jgi:predicted metal-dependent hydrolase
MSKRSGGSPPNEYMWQIDGHAIPYQVKVSQRARYVRLEIRGDGRLVVTRPAHVPLSAVEGILLKKKKWIIRHHEQRKREMSAHAVRAYEDGDTFLYLGSEVVLRVTCGDGMRVTVGLEGTELRAVLPASVPEEQRPQVLKAAIEKWYRAEAARQLPPRVHELARRDGLTFRRIFIKGQKTRWGSCSSLGNLNFNWRLMMCPPEVIDYIIIHELCHLREMNHSPRFWKLVEERCPDYKERKAWLKQKGGLIMRKS